MAFVQCGVVSGATLGALEAPLRAFEFESPQMLVPTFDRAIAIVGTLRTLSQDD